MPCILFILISISPVYLLDKIDNVRLPLQYEAFVLMKNHLQDGRELIYRFKLEKTSKFHDKT
jgi:hypothetical protein